jgi:glycosyltransferase involved in cell wall biosynthesis
MGSRNPKERIPVPDRPLVSVIIPAFQAEATLGAAISSVLTQTYAPVEIVVCDDGSTDRTGAVAAAYGDLSGGVRVVTQPNGGLPSARNAAIDASTGDLLALLDADDQMLPPYLDRAVDRWVEAGRGRRIVCSNGFYLTEAGINPKHRRLDGDGSVPPLDQRMRILEGNFVNIFTVFPRALYDEIGGFDTQMRALEDYDFWLRAIFAGWEVHFQEEPSALYRRSDASMSRRLETMEHYERRLLEKVEARRADGDLRLTSAEEAFLARRLSQDPPGTYIRLGEAYVVGGHGREAARMFSQAAALRPSQRRLRTKASLLRLPLTATAFARLQARRHRDT